MHIDGIPAVPFRPTRDRARMNHIKDNHVRKHEQGIEYVDIGFVVEQSTVIPLKVLDHSEHRPHHDEETGSVQSPHVLFPGVRAPRLDRGHEDQSAVEANRNHHEEAEEGELHEEADDDDVGAQLEGCLGSTGLVAPACDAC